jgi:hypothetical protein
MVVHRHHTGNAIKVGQILNAGFIILQAGHQIDMHK